MAKTIVFCADGTWNGPGQGDTDAIDPEATNVLLLFGCLAGVVSPESLRLRDEQERSLTEAGEVVQVAKYLHGVGDSSNKLVQWLGGGLGAGIISRIVRGYTFISRNYAPGDAIVLTGFSRGAYTARALAGMIAKMGLLDAEKADLSDKEAAYRAGAAVWYAYRKGAGRGLLGWFDRLDALVRDLPRFLSDAPAMPLLADVPIAAVGVWDTVGSLGIPLYTRGDGVLDLFRFADTALSPKVAHGFHAISIDEERANFSPTFWDADPRITQTLFPGAHSDVGGGYLEHGLSHCALGWMMPHLASVGVRFAAAAPAGDPLAVAHKPWLHGVFAHLPAGPRSFPAGLLRSDSLQARLVGGDVVGDPGEVPAPYAPTALTGIALPAEVLPSREPPPGG